MGSAPALPIPIRAVDQFSAIFERFRKTGGNAFRDVSANAREATRAFSDLVQPIGRLAGVGVGGLGLAAAAEGMQSFARASNDVGRSAARLGISTQALQAYDRTIQTITGHQGAAAVGFETLATKLRGAFTGRDAEAAGVFKAYGIEIRGMNGEMRRSAEILPLVQQKLRDMKDPIARAELAMFLYGGAWKDFLDTATASTEALAKAIKPFQQLSDDEQKSLEGMATAGNAVTVSLGSLGEKMAADFAPSLKKVLDQGDKWLDQLRQSPEQLHNVEIGVGLLATAIGVTLVSSIALVMAKLNAWWALPAMKFIVAGAAAAATVAAVTGAVVGATLGAEIKGNPDEYPLQQTPGGYRPGDTMGGMIGRGHGAAVEQAKQPGFFSRTWDKVFGPAAPPASGAAVTPPPLPIPPNPAAAPVAPAAAATPAQTAIPGGVTVPMPPPLPAALAPPAVAPGAGGVKIDPSWNSAVSTIRGFAVPPGTKFNSQSKRGPGYTDSPYNLEMSPQEAANVEASMAAIRAAQKAGRNWNDVGNDGPQSESTGTTHHVQIDLPNLPQGGRAEVLNTEGPATVGLKVGRAMKTQ